MREATRGHDGGGEDSGRERETLQINMVNLQGFEVAPGESLREAHPLAIVHLTQGARPFRAAWPQSSKINNPTFCRRACVCVCVSKRERGREAGRETVNVNGLRVHKPNIHVLRRKVCWENSADQLCSSELPLWPTPHREVSKISVFKM